MTDTKLQYAISCLQVNDFLRTPGVSKANFCREALEGINRKTLDKLISNKKKKIYHGGNLVAYKLAWVFFEKKRILEGQPKSAARRKNEIDHPQGFEVSTSTHRRQSIALSTRVAAAIPPHSRTV